MSRWLPLTRPPTLDDVLEANRGSGTAVTATELAAGEPLEFVTCDQRQAQTADVLGLVLA